MSSDARTEQSDHARLAQYRRLLEADPSNAALRRDCISLAMALREYGQVMAIAQQALAISPADAEVRFVRANAMIGLQQYGDAITALQALLEQDAGNLAVCQNIGLCYYVQGQFGEARPYLEQVYEGGVRTPDLLRLLVSTLHHLGDVDAAGQITNDNPEPGKADAALAGMYGLLYLDLDDWSQAARYSARALTLNPNSTDGLVVQATLLTGRLNLGRALEQYQRILELAPDNPRALVGMGMLSILNQDLGEGRQWLSRGVEQMPNHAGSLVALGWVELLQGDLAAAEKSFQRVIDLDGSFAEGHGGLASVMALRGDQANCKRLMQIADRLDPEGLSAKFARSVLIRGAGDQAGASRMLLDTLASLAPGDGGPLSQLIGRLTRR